MSGQKPVLEVVAGVIERDARVLLSQRPAGGHLAGTWEFPGGKLKPGEPASVALAREFEEELGVVIQQARPLIRLLHEYPETFVSLDVWRVERYDNEPDGLEGQAIRWVEVASLDPDVMPAADRPVIAALRLPDRYVITPSVRPDTAFWRILENCFGRGSMVQLRLPQLSESDYRASATQAMRLVCAYPDARLILNCEPALAIDLGAHGVHLGSARASRLTRRPLPIQRLLGVSCHDVIDLRQASRLDADFIVLGPVRETATHPGAVPLGWDTFQGLAIQAQSPVYALGGVGPDHIRVAQDRGAQGIAGIRALWTDGVG